MSQEARVGVKAEEKQGEAIQAEAWKLTKLEVGRSLQCSEI